MAKQRNLNDAMETYKGNGGGGFFSLTNDKDTALVRFLVGSELVAEEDWFVVHPIEIEGKKRWLQCTEEGDCPGCRVNKPQIKLFLQLEDTKDGEVKVWERGRNFVSKVTGIITRNGPMYNRLYEIERNGKKGDTATTYELYGTDRDDKCTYEQMMEKKQKLLGEKDKNGLVLNLSYDNMVLAMQGKFIPPKSEKSENESSSSSSSRSSSSESRPVTRRERSNSSAEDVF